MLRKLDKSIISQYSRESLDTILRVNMRLVPDSYIVSTKAALALELPSQDSACCHAFLGWDVARVALHRQSSANLNLGHSLMDVLFDTMKGTFLPSCETACINPEAHFIRYIGGNKCFPIKKVFEVLCEISPNAANRLLDIGLIHDLFIQIKEKEKQENLLIYSIERSKFTILSGFFKRIIKQDFKILIVDFDIMVLNENKENNVTPDEFRESTFQNLIHNIKSNFNFQLASKPSSDMDKWHESIDLQIKYADIVIAVISPNILRLFTEWKIILIGNQTNESLTSNILEHQDCQIFKEIQLNDNVKYQYYMYKKIYLANKIKTAVIYEEELMADIINFFPLSFFVPKEMKKLLFMLEEIRK